MKRFLHILVLALVVASAGVVGWQRAAGSTLTLVLKTHMVQEAKEQTVSGQVTAVRDDSFTVRVNRGEETKQMDFLVDADTRITGRVEVDVKVKVTYRTKYGKNIATEVIVLED